MKMTPDQARAISYDAKRNAPALEFKLGDKVAWISRHNDMANEVTMVHRYYEEGHTFCRLAVPTEPAQFLDALPSLKECKRCRAMSARAVQYAKAAGLMRVGA